MTTSKNTTDEKQKTISVKRSFDIPASKVWKAWTEPESFKKWWGPIEYTCPDCTIDFKVGGKYFASMQAADGKKTWSTGTYKEIVPLKKIVYTDSFADSKGNVVPGSEYDMPEMPMETLVTVELEETAGKTTMLLHHTGIPMDMMNDCIKGWQSCFDKMENNFK